MGSWRPSGHETIPAVLAAGAEAHGDRMAVAFEGGSVTFADLEQRSTALANSLADLGVGPGDTVGVLMRNRQEILDAWFAAAKLGAIHVPINTANVGEYLRHQLATAGASVVLADTALAPEVARIAGRLPDLRHLGVASEPGAGAPVLDLPATVTVQPFEGLLSGDPERLPGTRPPRFDDPNAIIYTAGTTGPSKGAVMTQNYLVRAARQLADLRGIVPEDVCYSPLPLFHLNAMLISVLGPIAAGARGALDSVFSVSRFWDRVRSTGASQLAILGSMITMLWNQPEQEDDGDNPARVVIAAPVPADFHEAWEKRFGVRFIVAYGLSEAVPITVSTLLDPSPPGYSGKANPVFDVRLFDENDDEVAPDEVGEIVCRPLEPHVMFEGYYRNPEATVAMWRNLWFHTGDLGRMDADGNLAFVDRKKDYLRRRGENISSFELEQAIMLHPKVAEVAVHAVASDVAEDDVKACVVLKPGETLDPVELMGHCVANIPYFAVPRYVEFMESMPKNPVGRVLKYELRERGVTPETWDREAAGYVVPRRR
ncbi:MAG TPA: AMP-binding protein [Acidimicrobiia bacterium]|nr:AMP-binding protein [Acidimicrobiia bacterium]